MHTLVYITEMYINEKKFPPNNCIIGLFPMPTTVWLGFNYCKKVKKKNSHRKHLIIYYCIYYLTVFTNAPNTVPGNILTINRP